MLPPAPPRPPPAIRRHAAIDGFIDLFKAAIARRLPSAPYVLPLSGGRDSSHILFALHEAGHAPAACVTVRHFPPRGNDDEIVARELCAMLGIAHCLISQPSDRGLLERRKNAATHSCSDEHAQFVVLADHLRAHTRETYDGIGGDVLSQSGYLTPRSHAFFERGDIGGFAAFVLDGYGTALSEAALARTLAPRIQAAVPRERALARLCREIARHADGPNPTAAFFLANRTRREIALAPYGLMRDIVVYAPYLDAALYDFLAALPASVQMDRTLHTEAIARAWPRFAHVPYERKGAAVRDPRATRRLARTLTPIAARGARRWIRAAGVLPRLAAAAIDGRPERLWNAALLFYVDHIAEVASAGAAASRAR